VGVHVGGVDQVDPGVERPVDDRDRRFVVVDGHGAEVHCTERVGADVDTGAAEGAVLHGGLHGAQAESGRLPVYFGYYMGTIPG
jgi:hypothetical protein